MRATKGVQYVGKYLVTSEEDARCKMYTDNAREAVWMANITPGGIVTNIQGERDFYRDEQGRWRSRVI